MKWFGRRRKRERERQAWAIQRAELHRQALDEARARGHAGPSGNRPGTKATCLICGKDMKLHPPGRVLVADPAMCPRDSDG